MTKAQTPLPDAVCALCHTAFRPRYKNQSYCSSKCRGKARYSRRLAQNPQPKRKRRRIRCQQCDALFTPVSKRHRFCRDYCRVQWYRSRALIKTIIIPAHYLTPDTHDGNVVLELRNGMVQAIHKEGE